MKENRAASLKTLAVIVSLVLLLPACGYRVGGQAALIPPDVKTIAIPIFKNETPQFKIEQEMTAAVTQEFIERTRYRVTQNPAGADAVLRGTVMDIRQGVVTFNPKTGAATTLQIAVAAAVRITDLHSKKVIFSNPHYVFHGQYQVSPTASTLIEEDPAAISRLSQDFARALVTDVLESF